MFIEKRLPEEKRLANNFGQKVVDEMKKNFVGRMIEPSGNMYLEDAEIGRLVKMENYLERALKGYHDSLSNSGNGAGGIRLY